MNVGARVPKACEQLTDPKPNTPLSPFLYYLHPCAFGLLSLTAFWQLMIEKKLMRGPSLTHWQLYGGSIAGNGIAALTSYYCAQSLLSLFNARPPGGVEKSGWEYFRLSLSEVTKTQKALDSSYASFFDQTTSTTKYVLELVAALVTASFALRAKPVSENWLQLRRTLGLMAATIGVGQTLYSYAFYIRNHLNTVEPEEKEKELRHNVTAVFIAKTLQDHVGSSINATLFQCGHAVFSLAAAYGRSALCSERLDWVEGTALSLLGLASIPLGLVMMMLRDYGVISCFVCMIGLMKHLGERGTIRVGSHSLKGLSQMYQISLLGDSLKELYYLNRSKKKLIEEKQWTKEEVQWLQIDSFATALSALTALALGGRVKSGQWAIAYFGCRAIACSSGFLYAKKVYRESKNK
jgi:hypothetical protein